MRAVERLERHTPIDRTTGLVPSAIARSPVVSPATPPESMVRTDRVRVERDTGVFDIASDYYVGWQKNEVISALLDLQIDDAGWFKEASESSSATAGGSAIPTRSYSKERTPLATERAAVEMKNGAKAGTVLPLNKPVTTMGRPGIQVGAIMRKPEGVFPMHIESEDGIDDITPNSTRIGEDPVLLRNGDMACIAGIVATFFNY